MITVDLIAPGETDEEVVWSGPLPELPRPGDRISLKGRRGAIVWVPDRPAWWRLNDHDVASVAVAVEWVSP